MDEEFHTKMKAIEEKLPWLGYELNIRGFQYRQLEKVREDLRYRACQIDEDRIRAEMVALQSEKERLVTDYISKCTDEGLNFRVIHEGDESALQVLSTTFRDGELPYEDVFRVDKDKQVSFLMTGRKFTLEEVGQISKHLSDLAALGELFM